MMGAGVILDGLIGYSLRGAPEGETRALIELANRSSGQTASLDVPSGMNPDLGDAPGLCARTAATLTLALPKTGLRAGSIRGFTGEIYVGDISVQRSLYELVGAPLEFDPFADGYAVRVGDWVAYGGASTLRRFKGRV